MVIYMYVYVHKAWLPKYQQKKWREGSLVDFNSNHAQIVTYVSYGRGLTYLVGKLLCGIGSLQHVLLAYVQHGRFVVVTSNNPLPYVTHSVLKPGNKAMGNPLSLLYNRQLSPLNTNLQT